MAVSDESIMDAARHIAASQGWAGLRFRTIAAQAQVSVRPLRDRYESSSQLAAQLWRGQLCDSLIAQVSEAVKCADQVVLNNHNDSLAALVEQFFQPSETLKASMELLIVARFDPVIALAVSEKFPHELERLLFGPESAPDRSLVAKRCLIVLLLFGLVTERWRSWASEIASHEISKLLEQSLRREVNDEVLPNDQATFLDEPQDFHTSDPMWEALLGTLVQSVARVGYEATTTDQLAKESGCSEGFIFRKYPTKRDLFVDAAHRGAAHYTKLQLEFANDMAQRYSEAVGGAVLLREWLLPKHEDKRTISLELSRVALHDEKLAKLMTDEQMPVLEENLQIPNSAGNANLLALAHVGFSAGSGAFLLSDLLPQFVSLPLTVVEF
ncbi:MAG: TetR family transcriptional regulator [Actinobacteria bacterium]|uniref:Unannotated protein n=1 Tax=freshwater metagenome TaxID=449393 RepID=A0A6J5YMT6_9ZZZZ|nr:TetR family transcriptional regulator [Actinomycetota bacterium]